MTQLDPDTRRRDTIERAVRYGAGGFGAVRNLTDAQLLACIKAPALRRFALGHDFGAGALLLGATGVGKSTAMAYVCRRYVRARAEAKYDAGEEWERSAYNLVPHDACAWTAALDLPLARLQQALGEGEAELVARAKSSDLLCLDDMAWESTRAGAADVVPEVIAARYDSGRVTLVSSGLTLAGFTERYGEAVVRRICEAGGGAGVVVDAWPREARP